MITFVVFLILAGNNKVEYKFKTLKRACLFYYETLDDKYGVQYSGIDKQVDGVAKEGYWENVPSDEFMRKEYPGMTATGVNKACHEWVDYDKRMAAKTAMDALYKNLSR